MKYQQPWWVVVGTLLGLAAALAGTLREAGPQVRPGGAVATVNGEHVTRGRFEQMLARNLASDVALARVVDEELLVQRGLELDLARQHNAVRSALLQAVTQIVVAENAASEVTDGELEVFFNENRSVFGGPARLQVDRILFSGHTVGEEEAELRAITARGQLMAGRAFSEVKARLGDEELFSIPAEPLPPAVLNQHIGPTLLRRALALQTGQISQPIKVGKNTHLLRVVDRQEGEPLEYQDVKTRVLAEFRRRQNQVSLEAYLAWLHARAEIEVYASSESSRGSSPASPRRSTSEAI